MEGNFPDGVNIPEVAPIYGIALQYLQDSKQ